MDILDLDLSRMDDDQWIEIEGEDEIITFLKNGRENLNIF